MKNRSLLLAAIAAVSLVTAASASDTTTPTPEPAEPAAVEVVTATDSPAASMSQADLPEASFGLDPLHEAELQGLGGCVWNWSCSVCGTPPVAAAVNSCTGEVHCTVTPCL